MNSDVDQNAQVVLVDQFDTVIGVEDKLVVHQKGLCHRAYSVFVFRQRDELELLLQKRSVTKYHSAGLWSNTCCSHPAPGEEMLGSAQRRLQYEMGVKASLTYVDRFHYRVALDNNLIEDELDSVYIAKVKGACSISMNPEEVQACEWVRVTDLMAALYHQPECYTAWLAQALDIALLNEGV